MLIPPAWSMSLIVVFYFIAPFLVKKKNYFIIILMGLSFALSAYLYKNGYAYNPWIYRSIFSELVFFLLGILSYRFMGYFQENIKNAKFLQKIMYVALILFILCFSYIPIYPVYRLFLFLGFLAVSLPFIFSLSKNWKKDKHFGELSFPIYLSHDFIIDISEAIQIPEHWKGEFVVIFSILIAFLLNQFIVKRIEKFRQKTIKITS